MGIMDKIKRATGTDEQYDDIYDNEYYDGFDDYGDAGMDAQTQQVNMNQTQQGYAAPTGTGGMTGSAYTPAAYSPAAGTSAGVFSSSTGGISLSGSAIEMKVVKPEHFESVPQIIFSTSAPSFSTSRTPTRRPRAVSLTSFPESLTRSTVLSRRSRPTPMSSLPRM